MIETRRILLDGAPTEVRVQGDWLIAPDGRRIAADQALHLAPCAPSKIICVHLNFMSRVDELKTSCPATPSYFQKPPSCLNGHRGEVVRPHGCKYLNYEGEVAAVIGKPARNIRVSEAEDHIAGYTLANDFGLHDFRDTDRGSMVRVKGADTLGAVGPGLVRGWRPQGKRIVTPRERPCGAGRRAGRTDLVDPLPRGRPRSHPHPDARRPDPDRHPGQLPPGAAGRCGDGGMRGPGRAGEPHRRGPGHPGRMRRAAERFGQGARRGARRGAAGVALASREAPSDRPPHNRTLFDEQCSRQLNSFPGCVCHG
ncbi:MAG: fumarylacetoacetate hydrolase family protein [Caulobacteraceae bacterium]